MLDVKRLEVLLAVVEAGSVTGAAARLGYTPSAVSQQVLRLEREARQPLLERHARGSTPTDAGVVLAAHARRVLRQLAAAQADLDDLAGLRRGTVVLGAFPTAGSSFLPLAVRRFQQEYPGITLEIRSGRETALMRMLEQGEVALSLLWDYHWRPVPEEELTLTELLSDPTVLLVGSDHRLARRHTVHLADLADEAWIIRAEGHPVVEVLQRSAVAAGFTPRIAFHAHDYAEAQAMVSVGLGVALAPRTATVNKHPEVRVVGLGSTAPSRRILVAHRNGRLRAPAEIALEDVLVETARSYSPT
jgi:DNA-binding transcriptional LysR family regulator